MCQSRLSRRLVTLISDSSSTRVARLATDAIPRAKYPLILSRVSTWYGGRSTSNLALLNGRSGSTTILSSISVSSPDPHPTWCAWTLMMRVEGES